MRCVSVIILLETTSTSESGVQPQRYDAASVKMSETNVTFHGHGVNFYLRLGAMGKFQIVSSASQRHYK